MLKNKITAAAALFALSGAALVHAASPAVVTFTYTDLKGSYAGNAGGGTFTAVASSISPLVSSGTVSRILPAASIAVFNAGFEASAGASDAVFSISVFSKTAFTAQGVGSMTLTDFDGDQIRADIDGTWVTTFGGRTFFNGNLRRVTFVNSSGFNRFNSGPLDPGFDMFFFNNGALTGSLVQLHIIRPALGFFNTQFTNNSVQTSGQIVPTPGAMALLGVGGLIAARRRRA